MPVESQYRDVVNRLAVALLFFEGAFMITGGATGLLGAFLPKNTVVAEIIAELLGGFFYCLIFILPVFLFRLISKEKEIAPTGLSCRLPRETPLYIFIGVAVIMGAAYLNSQMVSIFDYATYSEEVIWNRPVTGNYQLILSLLTVAVIPAFVEELLFRGLILSNLRPYGEVTAVVASALLFGVMHQNVEQLFYATVAGLVLGYLYVRTRSLWTCILLHFVNNFISVFRVAVAERLPASTANIAIGILHAAVCVLGVAAAIFLMLRQRDERRAPFLYGCFERDLPPHPDHPVCEIALSRRVRLFFSVPMIVFLAICCLRMGGHILFALLL